MEERVKKAFDFASESTKQLITLSTAILTLTITFSNDVFQSVDAWTKELLTYAWIIYLLSILFGILTLLALTGTLDPIKRKRRFRKRDRADDQGDLNAAVGQSPLESRDKGAPVLPSIQGLNVRLLSAGQIILFLVATGLVVKSGTSAIKSLSNNSKEDPSIVESRIREAHGAVISALLTRDTAAIEQYLAGDSVILDGLGQVMSRNQLVNEIHSGDLTFEAIETEGVRVMRHGDGALELGTCKVKANMSSKDIGGKYRYSALFIKSKEGWQGISFQLTRLEDSKPPVQLPHRRPGRIHRRPSRGIIKTTH